MMNHFKVATESVVFHAQVVQAMRARDNDPFWLDVIENIYIRRGQLEVQVFVTGTTRYIASTALGLPQDCEVTSAACST